MSINIEIKTPSGYQSFDGIKRYWHESFIRVRFEDGYVDTALNHKFIGPGRVELLSKDLISEAADLVNADYVSGAGFVKSIELIEEGDWFYDPVNVQNGSIYCHDNDKVSHNTFFGTGDTLIDGNVLMSLRAQNPKYEQGNCKIYEEYKEGHEYMLCADVAKGVGKDYSTFNIIDITQRPFRQVAVYRNNKISPLLFPDEIYKWAKAYGEAYVVVENNDAGMVVVNGLYHDLEYENMHLESVTKGKLGVYMDRKVKRLGCSGFKDALESGGLEIMDEETIKEINSFEARGNSYEASDGNHDDLVMNFVMFGYFVNTRFFSNMTDINLREFLHEQRIREIEDDVVPFGVIDDHMDIEETEIEMPGPEWALVKDQEWTEWEGHQVDW